MVKKQKKLPKHAAIAQTNAASESPSEKWATWERKVERLHRKDYASLKKGWLAHIPEIQPVGSPPQDGLDSISSIAEIFPKVPRDGDFLAQVSGARPAVLHEAIYLAHKAVHVQISCAEAVRVGRHTWAIVDAYQASLFALGSILAFVGITVERHDNNFILIDVWATPDSRGTRRSGLSLDSEETYQLVRFKTLDHFQKWAILKRVLRTLKIKSPLVQLTSEALAPHDEKSFAKYRNFVNYNSGGWLSNDLLANDPSGPVVPAKSEHEIFDEIYAGTPLGTVYLMCALTEIACMFAGDLAASGVVEEEVLRLERRFDAHQVLASFDWRKLYDSSTS
jgi:hypothetical protein